ncbi:ATP-binding protein [Streptomyces alkaliterrae]|uniref:ATP-binding protein n=1 Tax=Streptomyces alkaliterrae TaxID=2213162 RepID=A0A5P0YW23_9ACTN|nr:ATP-binding protein [Streptomyces alkaliterrae]MBB1261903.1 ATP-binding protein [Streptomyces alkaliterrae]MQS04493.1 ATP-binding protein [Streptomyces alkaliterrae]
MTGTGQTHEPHPHIGGRAEVLRALAAWRMEWPGSPRVVLLTGSPGTGRSWLLTGFLMLCEPEYRKRLPLDAMDPATVPPELPPPAVPGPAGLTAAQLLWVLADHYGVQATRTADVFTELGAREETLTIVVPDVDQAGPVRTADEPRRLAGDVLRPLAALPNVRLLAELPRELVDEVAAGLPPGAAQVIDLDEPRWADPDGLALQAEAQLDPLFGAPDLPFTTDPAARRALGRALAERTGAGAGSRLTVRLAVNSILAHPQSFDPADPALLPATVGEALDLHARRLGADPATLRLLLGPLALAEGEGLPVQLLGPLADAVAETDMSAALADGMLLVAPFIEPVRPSEAEATSESASPEDPAARPTARSDANGEAEADNVQAADRPLLRLAHPALADEIRAWLPDVAAAQTRVAMALLAEVPGQDWSQADPYVRDHIAAHTLEAGLLPQLLTDPGLFTYADPVLLRAAVEAVPSEALAAPARTYLRTAPLLTRTQVPARVRAALLETAFTEDGLDQYAAALHRIVPDLPWRTLWTLPLNGVSAAAIGRLPRTALPATDGTEPENDPAGTDTDSALPVAVLVVPPGTPGARILPAGGEAGDTPPGAVLLLPLDGPAAPLDADPALVRMPSEEERAATPLGISRGGDYVRIWRRGPEQRLLTAYVSATPLAGADIHDSGVLLLATETGAKALRVTPPPETDGGPPVR